MEMKHKMIKMYPSTVNVDVIWETVRLHSVTFLYAYKRHMVVQAKAFAHTHRNGERSLNMYLNQFIWCRMLRWSLFFLHIFLFVEMVPFRTEPNSANLVHHQHRHHRCRRSRRPGCHTLFRQPNSNCEWCKSTICYTIISFIRIGLLLNGWVFHLLLQDAGLRRQLALICISLCEPRKRHSVCSHKFIWPASNRTNHSSCYARLSLAHSISLCRSCPLTCPSAFQTKQPKKHRHQTHTHTQLAVSHPSNKIKCIFILQGILR